MKSFVGKTSLDKDELKNLSIAELIKIRLFNLKGSVSKKDTLKKEAELELLKRADDLTLDDIIHLIEGRAYKNKMTPAHDRVKGFGTVLCKVYNQALKRLVPFDHPYRYRYVVNEFLDCENAKTETKAWLIGNSHTGAYWTDRIRSLTEILDECNKKEFDLIAKQLINGKSSESWIFLNRNIDENLRKKLMSFSFINARDVRNITVTPEFISEVPFDKVPKILTDFGYNIIYNDKNIKLNISKKEMKKILFPYSTNGEHVNKIKSILSIFYGEE